MRLSKNFVLDEFGISDTAPPEVIRTAWLIATLILQPMRDKYGPIKITSGYRSPSHNKKIGGSSTSDHIYRTEPENNNYRGAVDVVFLDYIDDPSGRLAIFEDLMARCKHAFSQLIWYTGTNHFHIGLVNSNKWGEVMVKHDGGYARIGKHEEILDYDSRLEGVIA